MLTDNQSSILKENQILIGILNPYENKDEMHKDFDRLFPQNKRSNDVKIFVVEFNGVIVFAVTLLIYFEPNHEKQIGYMHDFLFNRYA